jgi:hypothetical protein
MDASFLIVGRQESVVILSEARAPRPARVEEPLDARSHALDPMTLGGLHEILEEYRRVGERLSKHGKDCDATGAPESDRLMWLLGTVPAHRRHAASADPIPCALTRRAPGWG